MKLPFAIGVTHWDPSPPDEIDDLQALRAADRFRFANEQRAWIDVELWPTAHQFNREHRLRIQIASAAFPRYARNPGTGHPAATATRLAAADHEIQHGPVHPSQIMLPVVASRDPRHRA